MQWPLYCSPSCGSDIQGQLRRCSLSLLPVRSLPVTRVAGGPPLRLCRLGPRGTVCSLSQQGAQAPWGCGQRSRHAGSGGLDPATPQHHLSSEHHRAGPGPGEGRQTSFRSAGRLRTWWWEAITSLAAVSHRATWKMRHLYPIDELVHRVLTFVFSIRSLAVTVSSASHLLCKYPSFFSNTFNIPPNKNYDCVCLHGIYGESTGCNFGWYIAFHAFWNKTFCPKLESSIPETLQNTHYPGKWRVTHKDAGTPGPH